MKKLIKVAIEWSGFGNAVRGWLGNLKQECVKTFEIEVHDINKKLDKHYFDIVKLSDRVQGFEKYHNVEWFEKKTKGYKKGHGKKGDVIES